MGLAESSAENVFWQEPNIALAMRAAKEAVLDAAISWDHIEPFRRGCVIGTSKGGMKSLSRACAADLAQDSPILPPEIWPMFWPNTPASLVAETWNVKGPVLCPVAACATGLMSLWRGAELIREGACDVVLAGSTDASLQPAVLGAFSRMGVLARRAEDPASSCRPFDLDRSGFVVGEGAAVIVMERADLAQKRGAVPYAEWLAGGCVSDPTGIAHLNPEADSLIWLLHDVLGRSQTEPEEIDYLNLHGTGTWDNDRAETRAIRRGFRFPCGSDFLFQSQRGVGSSVGSGRQCGDCLHAARDAGRNNPTHAKFASARPGMRSGLHAEPKPRANDSKGNETLAGLRRPSSRRRLRPMDRRVKRGGKPS